MPFLHQPDDQKCLSITVHDAQGLFQSTRGGKVCVFGETTSLQIELEVETTAYRLLKSNPKVSANGSVLFRWDKNGFNGEQLCGIAAGAC